MNDKRFVRKIDNSIIVEKITFEQWCNHLTVSSYFINDEVLSQIEYFYPETLMA